jgi:hypothetical protein
MKPSRIEEVVKSVIQTRWPVFLWGPPGVGKSSIVRSIAKQKKLELLDVRASLLDPTDLRGIPTVEKGKAKWCPPSFLPSDPKSKGLLFFDELNAAPPLVQASLYQLTLDRCVGEYRLPDGWSILAAGNRAEDRSVTFRMPAALINRFVHLDYEVDFEDWRDWAVVNKMHPLVVGFLSTRRELLFNMDKPDKPFPTPRSWEMVSDILSSQDSFKDCQDIILGVVGEGAMMEFIGYCESAISEEIIEKIIANPSAAKLPKKLGDQYALISYLSFNLDKTDVQKGAEVLLSRFAPELGVLLLRNCLKLHPKFAMKKGVQEFISKHKDVI